jgi:hypothetical protein
MISLALVLTVTAAWATTGGVAAASPKTIVPVPVPSVGPIDNGLHLTAAQLTQANQKFGFVSDKAMWGEFVITNGVLTTVDPMNVIRSKYGLSADQVATVQGILTYSSEHHTTSAAPKAGVVQPDVSMNGTVLYLTYSDMVGFLFTAAVAGPYALAAAINAMGWLFGGPIGGAVALIMSVIGITTIAGLAYLIIQAHVLHQGIYFGITWNWIFPNYVQGTWCGCN